MADSFLSGVSDAYNFGRRVRLNHELAKDAADPGLDPDSGYTYPKPQDVGPRQPGLEDAQGAGMPTQTAPQPATPQQRTARRAAVYRQYGSDADADKLLQDSATLGLTDANTAQTQQNTANAAIRGQAEQIGLEAKRRENDEAVSQKKIRDAAGAKLAGLTDEQGQPRQPTDDELVANQKELTLALYAGGHTAAANEALTQMKDGIKTRIDADSSARKAAANQVYTQVSGGDYNGVAAFSKRFRYGPAGASIDKITPGPQPGTLALAFTDDQGPKTKVVPEPALRQQLLEQMRLQGSDNAAVAQKTFEQVDAQIEQSKAAARASDASSRRQGAETTAITEASSRRKVLDDALQAAAPAYDVPEAQRTPAQRQSVAKYERLKMLESARNGGALGGAGQTQQNRTVNASVNGVPTTIKTTADGDFYLAPTSKTDKTPRWTPITRADQVRQASPSQAVAGSIPPPAQRVVGQVYTNAAGTRALWNGAGWEVQ